MKSSGNFVSRIMPLTALAILVFLFVLGFLAFTAFSSASLGNEIALTEASITDLEEQTQKLNDKGVATALSAKRLMDAIDEEYLQWSKVIQRIQNTVPKDAQSRPKIDFLSYSGGRNGKLSLTSRTTSSAEDPYKDTAELIKTFNDSDDFVEAFIPSISKTVKEDASTILNYTLQLQFVEQEEKTVSRKVNK